MEVADAVRKIEAKQTAIVQTLSSDEEFTSLLISATIIAYKTHINEKYKKLKCALINSVDSILSYDIQQVYLQFIDDLTISHIGILRQIFNSDSLIKGLNSYEKIYNKLKEAGMPSLPYSTIELTTFRYMILDLEAKGLLYVSNELQEIENTTYHGSYLITEDSDSENSAFLNVTKFGKDFLLFIENEEYDFNN